MSIPFFSVVIPVYRPVREKLKSCLDSVALSQHISSEILLMDDGNLETDAALIGELAAQYPMARLVTLPHGGVSRARNQGAALARGTYLTFLDADDELSPGILDEVCSLLAQDRPDLLITRIAREPTGEESPGECIRVCAEHIVPFNDHAGISTQRLIRYYLTMQDPLLSDHHSWVNRAVHGRFVRTSLARSVCFREELAFGEDVIWNFELLKKAVDVRIYGKAGYCYYKNQGSVTQTWRENFPEEASVLLRHYRRCLSEWDTRLRPFYDSAVLEYFTILCRVYIFAGPEQSRWTRFMEQMQNPLWRRSFYRADLGLMKKKYALLAMLGRAGMYEALYGVCYLHYR